MVVTLTAADHRALAVKADHRALRALTPAESRSHRRQARDHRLDALLAEYHLDKAGLQD